MLNFTQLRVFYEVAKTHNFTTAAERLTVSQPAVSLQMKSLEEALGTRLYERDGKRFALTEAGVLLQSYVERIFLLEQEAERQLALLRHEDQDSLRISTTKLIASYFLPAVVGAFKTLHHETGLRLNIGTNAWAIEDVLIGGSDVGVVVNAVSEELVKTTIHEDPLVLILPPDHPAAADDVAVNLERETLILREAGSITRSIVEEALRAKRVKPRRTMELADPEAIKRAVRAGLGLSVITTTAIQEEVRAGTLAARPFQDGQHRMRIEAIYRRGRQLSPTMQAFLEALSPVPIVAKAQRSPARQPAQKRRR